MGIHLPCYYIHRYDNNDAIVGHQVIDILTNQKVPFKFHKKAKEHSFKYTESIYHILYDYIDMLELITKFMSFIIQRYTRSKLILICLMLKTLA